MLNHVVNRVAQVYIVDSVHITDTPSPVVDFFIPSSAFCPSRTLLLIYTHVLLFFSFYPFAGICWAWYYNPSMLKFLYTQIPSYPHMYRCILTSTCVSSACP